MTARLTARGRLALLYTGLVLAAGAVLTALTYALVQRSMRNRWVVLRGDAAATPSPTPVGDGALPPVAERLRAETLGQLLTQSALALAVVTVLAGVLGWLIAGRVLRPIRAMSATARRLSATNLSERLPVGAPADEVATLAGTINGMLDRIQLGIADRDRLLASQRMFVANAAHELRTPLTTIRTALDVTLEGQSGMDELLAMAADVRTAIEHSQRTLDGLLTLARSQTGPTDPRPVDLADLAAASLDAAAGPAAARGVSLRRALRPAPTCGEPVLFERMVDNLVDNAVRYNQAGGHVTVTTGAAAGQAVLRVANTGPRVAPDEARRLLEPFVRGAAQHRRADGAGLGLSIVHAVVTAHRGQLDSTARPGGGLEVTVRLRTGDAPEVGATEVGATEVEPAAGRRPGR